MTLTVTFAQGTDPNIAQVLVQNQVAIALPTLPAMVRQIGVVTQKSSPNFLLLVNLISPDGRYSADYLSNYAELQIQDPIKRVSGVGNVQIFGLREYSMRIWLNPDRMAGLKLTVDDVVSAIQTQNVQVAAGTIGAPPAPKGTQLELVVNTLGRLTHPEQFADIIVKTGSDGQIVRLREVGSAVLGAKDYTVTSFHDGRPTVALGVSLLPGANAVATSARVRKEMENLARRFNPGLAYTIDYDTNGFCFDIPEGGRAHPLDCHSLGRVGCSGIPADLASRNHSTHRRSGVAGRHICRPLHSWLFTEHPFSLWTGSRNWDRCR
jgi:multidrug efflux pump subunit AcrB